MRFRKFRIPQNSVSLRLIQEMALCRLLTVMNNLFIYNKRRAVYYNTIIIFLYLSKKMVSTFHTHHNYGGKKDVSISSKDDDNLVYVYLVGTVYSSNSPWLKRQKKLEAGVLRAPLCAAVKSCPPFHSTAEFSIDTKTGSWLGSEGIGPYR